MIPGKFSYDAIISDGYRLTVVVGSSDTDCQWSFNLVVGGGHFPTGRVFFI
jgi:hypothetical protein